MQNPAVIPGIIITAGTVLPVDEAVDIIENRRIDNIVDFQTIGPEVLRNDVIVEVAAVRVERKQS